MRDAIDSAADRRSTVPPRESRVRLGQQHPTKYVGEVSNKIGKYTPSEKKSIPEPRASKIIRQKTWAAVTYEFETTPGGSNGSQSNTGGMCGWPAWVDEARTSSRVLTGSSDCWSTERPPPVFGRKGCARQTSPSARDGTRPGTGRIRSKVHRLS